jgi:hypothetical protein
MKNKYTLLTLLFVYCLTTSLQCDKCNTGIIRLDETKSWLPLKGRTQLSFIDNSGTSTSFKLKVVDTTELVINECGGTYGVEYITTTLFLNQNMKDSIHFSLASGGWLCASAASDNNINFSICNVFGKAKEGIDAKRLKNQRIGNRTYQEVILLIHGPISTNNIDSVFIANNAGVVGFNYVNKKYALQ